MLERLFDYKIWANSEIIAAVRKLSGKNQERGTSAIRILNHTYIVDRIFAAHLSGSGHDYSGTNTPDTPALPELQARIAESDRWYREYVASVDAGSLTELLEFKFTDGDTGILSREQMLFHVLNHGAYHRGAIGRLTADAGYAPPADTITRFLRLSMSQTVVPRVERLPD